MPRLKELSFCILYNTSPPGAPFKLKPLVEYKGPDPNSSDKNPKQAIRWIEATAGQRFWIGVGPDECSPVGAFPPLDVKTVHGGLKRLHSQNLIVNPDFNYFMADDAAQNLAYIYYINVYFDGNPKPAVSRTYRPNPQNPGTWMVIGHGDVVVNDKQKTHLPCTWQFQRLNTDQSLEDDLLGCFGQLGIQCTVDLEAAAQDSVGVVEDSSKPAIIQSAGPGKIEVQVMRVVDLGNNYTGPSLDMADRIHQNGVTIRALRSEAITATHKVETLHPVANSGTYQLTKEFGLIGIDASYAPYLTAVFNYRDDSVLQKFGCKTEADLNPMTTNKQAVKRGRDDEDDEQTSTAVPTRSNVEANTAAAAARAQARKRTKPNYQKKIDHLNGRLLAQKFNALPGNLTETADEGTSTNTQISLAAVTTRTTQNSRNAAINGLPFAGNTDLYGELRAQQAMQTTTESTEAHKPVFEYPIRSRVPAVESPKVSRFEYPPSFNDQTDSCDGDDVQMPDLTITSITSSPNDQEGPLNTNPMKLPGLKWF